MWRGGHLICLAKKAGANYTCDAFRSILLASIPGKAYHRTLRARLIPALCHTSSDLQAGSKPGISTDGIAAAARAYQEQQFAAKRLPAVVYFDLKAAYYRMLRQLVVPMGEPEDRFLRLMHSLQLPEQALTELVQHLQALSSLELANVTPHTIAAVSDLCRGTWFRMDRSFTLTYTARGSRPGDPLADVLFAFSLSTYVKSCEQALTTAGLDSPLPQLRSTPLTEQLPCSQAMGFASWADDMARLLAADSWPELVEGVEKTMQTCVEHAASCGMQFAYAKHKTAVLMPAATGRCRAKAAPANARPSSFAIPNRVTQEIHHLEVISAYQHLGSVVAADGSPSLEIAHRRAMAIGITRAHSRKLFSNTAFPIAVRRNILRSLAVSKFTYGAASLNLSSAIHRRAWCHAYTDLWRRLLRRDWSTAKRTHSYAVLHRASAPSPLLALAAARASFLRRLILHGPVECLHLLQAHWELQPERSWLGLVTTDIALVAQYVGSARLLQQQRSPLHALFDSYREDNQWWIRTVKSACAICIQDYATWHQHHGPDRTPSPVAAQAGPAPDAPAQLPTQAPPVPDSTVPPPPSVQQLFPCRLCSASFTLRKLFFAHMAKTHGCLSPARHFAPTSWCLACLGYFHSPLRVQQHLKQSSKCMLKLPWLIAPLSVSEVHAAEADCKQRAARLAKGHWQEHTATLPATRAYGPLQPTIIQRGDDEDIAIDVLSRLHRPSQEVLVWISDYVSGRTVEGKRAGTTDFWSHRCVSPTSA